MTELQIYIEAIRLTLLSLLLGFFFGYSVSSYQWRKKLNRYLDLLQ